MAGTLILCAGPIGNLADAPPRLAEVLSGADVIYAEDTRRARVLLDHLGVETPVRSYFVGNEAVRADEVERRLEDEQVVALVTDAGSPAISDPGVSAVRAAVAAGADVSGVPGPSAVILALGLSGFPADRFSFEGFLPRTGLDRSRRVAAIAAEDRTTVLFCAPGRLASDLTDLAERIPDRDVVVCREMTKLHEEVWRGTLADAAVEWSDRRVRGEVTVVVAGGPPPEPDFDAAIAAVGDAIEGGERPSSAVRRVAIETGVSRRALYEAVIGNR